MLKRMGNDTEQSKNLEIIKKKVTNKNKIKQFNQKCSQNILLCAIALVAPTACTLFFLFTLLDDIIRIK